MSYGLRTKDSLGNILLDTSDIVARIRYTTIANADTDGSIELSDISGKTTYTFSIPLEVNKCAHSVSISGTTFSWTAQSSGSPVTILSSQSLVGVIIVD